MASHERQGGPATPGDRDGHRDLKRRGEDRRARTGKPSARLVSPVAEPEAAEYVFELIRSLIAITRDYRDFRLTTYFLEMAAMEIARMKASRRGRTVPQDSTRATS